MKPPKTHTIKRPCDRVVDRRQLWALKLAATRRNQSTNFTEAPADVKFEPEGGQP
jgi:hypothetical protein